MAWSTTRRCTAAIFIAAAEAVAVRAPQAQRIQPKPVFPNLPPPMPPAEFVAMPLYLRTETPRPTY